MPAENVYPKPARLSWHEAAAFPLAGLTAYRALFSRAGLRAGETVLVLGAGSGVSTFAVSLAHQAGARVLVTSSSGEKIERARELGAEAASTTRTVTGWTRFVTWPAGRASTSSSTRSGRPGRTRCAACVPAAALVVFGATGGRDGRARGAADLLRPVLDPRHDDGQRARLRGSPAGGRRAAAGRRWSTACVRSPRPPPHTRVSRLGSTSASSSSTLPDPGPQYDWVDRA